MKKLRRRYIDRFEDGPPVMGLNPSIARELMERALERGAPIQDDELPDIPDGVVV